MTGLTPESGQVRPIAPAIQSQRTMSLRLNSTIAALSRAHTPVTGRDSWTTRLTETQSPVESREVPDPRRPDAPESLVPTALVNNGYVSVCQH
jgi:hypothetical protein